MNQNPSRSVHIGLLVLTYSSYTTEMLLSLWDSIMKEAAAFMHMEQGTESSSVVQSHFFSSRESTLKHIYSRWLHEGGRKGTDFLSTFFKLKGVKWPLYRMKHGEMLCEVQ